MFFQKQDNEEMAKLVQQNALKYLPSNWMTLSQKQQIDTISEQYQIHAYTDEQIVDFVNSAIEKIINNEAPKIINEAHLADKFFVKSDRKNLQLIQAKNHIVKK